MWAHNKSTAATNGGNARAALTYLSKWAEILTDTLGVPGPIEIAHPLGFMRALAGEARVSHIRQKLQTPV